MRALSVLRNLQFVRPPWGLGKDQKDGKEDCKTQIMKDAEPNYKVRNPFKRLATRPRNICVHAQRCKPNSPNTKLYPTSSFNSPNFISPRIIAPSACRFVQSKEPLGPSAEKCASFYKNSESHRYPQYSYYELKTIVDAFKKKQSAKQINRKPLKVEA